MLKRIGEYVTRHRSAVLWICFGFMAVYYATGVYPMTGAEGDDYAIAVGAMRIAQTGEIDTGFTYRYDVQAGTYRLLALLYQLTGFETLPLFCALSAVAGMCFIALSMVFISRLTGVALPLAGIILLIFPETVIEAYYGNSTMVAAPCLMAGLCVLIQRDGLMNRIAGGLLLGTAVWMRFDTILVTPAVLILLHEGRWRDVASWRSALLKTTLVGAVTAASAFALLYVSDADFLRIFGSTEAHRIRSYPLYDQFINVISFFNIPMTALIVAGLVRCIRRREWRLPAIAVAGGALIVVSFADMISTPKYFYYLLPFLALFAARALNPLPQLHTRAARAGAAALLLLALFQYLVPLDLSSFDRVWMWEWKGPVRGSWVMTDDHRRMVTGTVYSPLMWIADKRYFVDEYHEHVEAMRNLPDDVVDFCVPLAWRAHSHFRHRYFLMLLGYDYIGQELVPGVRLVGTWQRGTRTLQVRWEPTGIMGFQ